MALRRCKLNDKDQRRLLEFFVLEVTARAAADLMGFQVNTAALFYRKVRMLVAEKLEAEASGFAGEIELDESYFGGVRKGKRGGGAPQARSQCLAFSSVGARCIRKLLTTRARPR